MSQLVIGIPGPWEDQSEIIQAVARANPDTKEPRFLALGGLIMDMTTNQSFGLEIYEHDENLARAFEVAGQGRFTEDEISQIAGHKLTVYLVCGEPFSSPDLESREAARILLAMGKFMLDAGGFAVKIENSGLAHPAARWRHYAQQNTTLALYDAFVTMVGGDDYNYTCGMHAFGLPDVSVTTDIPIEEAPYLMNAFNQYQLLESPQLAEGAEFATSFDDPNLKMSHCSFGYDEGDLLNNPHGRWHLEQSDTPHEVASIYQDREEPLFMALDSHDPDVVTAVQQARGSFDWFLHHFQSPYEYGQYLIKTYIQDGEEGAHIWTALVDANDDRITVALFEVPPEFASYQAGQELSLKRTNVYDWCIQRNATMIGGFSRRLQRQHVPVERQQQFDLYSGTISFAPLEEILE